MIHYKRLATIDIINFPKRKFGCSITDNSYNEVGVLLLGGKRVNKN